MGRLEKSGEGRVSNSRCRQDERHTVNESDYVICCLGYSGYLSYVYTDIEIKKDIPGIWIGLVLPDGKNTVRICADGNSIRF